MADQKDEATFKVVDRRPFAPDGSTRETEPGAPQTEPGDVAGASERAAGVATADRTPTPAQAPAPARESARPPVRESARGADRREADKSGVRIPEAGSDGAYAIGESAPPGVEDAFTTLVSYLGTTAMFQLGLMADPGGERIPADLPAARHTIDMLEVIEIKTRGNLTPDESQLLDDVLYEVRMAYVEVGKRAARPK